MDKIKLSYKLGKAIEEIKEKLGEDHLFKIEWIMSNYKNPVREDAQLQNAINVVVEFVKPNDENRKKYFKAILEGFETDKPFSYNEFTYEDKEKVFNKFVEQVRGYFFSNDTYSLNFETKKGRPEYEVYKDRGLPATIYTVDSKNVSITLNINGGY
ncbi:hypothetical protein V7128_01650 [Neobacillus vireti]|uniref:hypothetical protein n=1 Tax=Neobacillus vireti TaxID=220686 RepID=UPI002FFE2607